MKTKVVVVDGKMPDREALREAVEILKRGGLVAFPTETVYGLGADALSAEATAKIFEAKGRPATNPLIVHVGSIEKARELVKAWPEEAEKLARAFWPGPLTLVLPKAEIVPAGVSAGLETVALRMPAHPVARMLMEEAGPLAAPSANRYTEVSPTCAEHVLKGLSGRVEMVVDGGSAEVGLESTILSLLGDSPEVLRPGMISAEAIGEVLGGIPRGGEEKVVSEERARPAPGLSRKHYSPRGAVRVVERKLFLELLENGGESRGFLGLRPPAEREGEVREEVIWLGEKPEEVARGLYGGFHTLDGLAMEEIIVEAPPRAGVWEALWDRLRRASV